MQRSVPVQVGPLHRLRGPAGHIREQDLQHRIVAPQTGLHNGVASAYVSPGYRFRAILAEEVNYLRVPCRRGEHQGCLVRFVERGVRVLVAERDEELAYLQEAQRRGEVEVGIGQAGDGDIGVVEEVWMGLEDALD